MERGLVVGLDAVQMVGLVQQQLDQVGAVPGEGEQRQHVVVTPLPPLLLLPPPWVHVQLAVLG